MYCTTSLEFWSHIGLTLYRFQMLKSRHPSTLAMSNRRSPDIPDVKTSIRADTPERFTELGRCSCTFNVYGIVDQGPLN